MPETPDHISPVLLCYCPKGGATLMAGPNRKRTVEAAGRHKSLLGITDGICAIGDNLSAMVHTLAAQGMIADPGITEPAFNETHGAAASIFSTRLRRN